MIAGSSSTLAALGGRHLSELAPPPGAEPELSVVMPCLDEVESLSACITRARRAMDAAGIAGEIIVADAGSTDGSQLLAASLGARVVCVIARDYGSAVTAGIEAARGRYILVGDADDSCDFGDLPRFVARLREGHDFVQGRRLPRGSGLGDALLGWTVRRWLGAPINDVHCGMRAFSRTLHARLDQRSAGMEFAVEGVIGAGLQGASIVEVPVARRNEPGTGHARHLRTSRDGWRQLRHYLAYGSGGRMPVPGALLLGAGALACAWRLVGGKPRTFHA